MIPRCGHLCSGDSFLVEPDLTTLQAVSWSLLIGEQANSGRDLTTGLKGIDDVVVGVQHVVQYCSIVEGPTIVQLPALREIPDASL